MRGLGPFDVYLTDLYYSELRFLILLSMDCILVKHLFGMRERQGKGGLVVGIECEIEEGFSFL